MNEPRNGLHLHEPSVSESQAIPTHAYVVFERHARGSSNQTNCTGSFLAHASFVDDGKGGYSLAAPRPYSVHDAVMELAEAQGVKQGIGSENWHDDTVLASGIGRFTLWIPPSVRTLHCAHGQFKVPLPGLVMLARQGVMYVVAVGNKRRPTLDTPIFHAPLMNLYRKGDLCWGTVKAPAPDLASRDAWIDALFLTKFSHVNHGQTCQSAVKAKDAERDSGSLVRLYKQLQRAKATVFPRRELVSKHMTLGELLRYV